MAAARARCTRSCFSCTVFPAGPLSTEFVSLRSNFPTHNYIEQYPFLRAI
jgi:hypothetical protein